MTRPPTASELDEMCRIVRDSAGAPGVVGFSTGLIYMPGLFAGTDELRALVAAAAEPSIRAVVAASTPSGPSTSCRAR